jgi:hypothetical protein
MESDAAGLSEEERRAFVDVEGKWALHLRDLGSRRLDALGALRRALALSPVAVSQVVNSEAPLFVGAMVEVEQLEETLASAGARTEKSRLS